MRRWPGLRRFVLLLALALVSASVAAQRARDDGPILVLISFDGWRWDYIDRHPAPNMKALAARGVRAKAMIPSFPVLTFPNHYTLVTGLYPAHHGIVGNWFYDPLSGETFGMSKPESNSRPPRRSRPTGRSARRPHAPWPATHGIDSARPSPRRSQESRVPTEARTTSRSA